MVCWGWFINNVLFWGLKIIRNHSWIKIVNFSWENNDLILTSLKKINRFSQTPTYFILMFTHLSISSDHFQEEEKTSYSSSFVFLLKMIIYFFNYSGPNHILNINTITVIQYHRGRFIYFFVAFFLKIENSSLGNLPLKMIVIKNSRWRWRK